MESRPQGEEGPELPKEIKPKKRRRRKKRPWYELKRTYLVVMVLGIAAGGLAGLGFVYRYLPGWLVKTAIQQAKFPASARAVYWEKDGALSLRDPRVGEFFRAARIDTNWNWRQLIEGSRLGVLLIDRPQLWLSRLDAAQKAAASSVSGGELPLIVDQLILRRPTIIIDNLGPELPAVPVTIEGDIVFQNFNLADWEKSDGLDQEETVPIENLLITSPYDALSPIMFFKHIRLTFTWRELLNNRIRKVRLVQPILYLGPDLFWFADQFDTARDSGQQPAAPWSIGTFDVKAGRLAINAFGQPTAVLPFNVSANTDNIRTDRLDELSVKTVLYIHRQDIEYPDYKLALLGVSGKVDFALPPSDEYADNVVPTIYVDRISWNNISVTNAWASVTFDKDGIFGNFGGESYGGYVNGNMAIYFRGGFPWTGQIFADRVGLEEPIGRMGSTYVRLTGSASGELQVRGEATTIMNTRLSLELNEPGKLEIVAIDDLLSRIPEDWNSLKRELSRVTLDSFRKYDYSRGRISFDYRLPESAGRLELRGRQGRRIFNVSWLQENAEGKPVMPEGKTQPGDDPAGSAGASPPASDGMEDSGAPASLPPEAQPAPVPPDPTADKMKTPATPNAPAPIMGEDPAPLPLP